MAWDGPLELDSWFRWAGGIGGCTVGWSASLGWLDCQLDVSWIDNWLDWLECWMIRSLAGWFLGMDLGYPSGWLGRMAFQLAWVVGRLVLLHQLSDIILKIRRLLFWTP